MNRNIFEKISIPTYIINLKSHPDRLKHVLMQFEGKPEFDVNIIEACEHKIGAVGLWQSMTKAVLLAVQNEDDVMIMVEDDHEFTEHYNRDFLIKNIIEGAEQSLDILSGGIAGGFSHAVPITKNRYWINHFWATQFIVIYNKFFQQILEADFKETDTADDFLSELTANKMVLHPFISVKTHTKDLGKNDFIGTNQRLNVYSIIYEKYILKKKVK